MTLVGRGAPFPQQNADLKTGEVRALCVCLCDFSLPFRSQSNRFCFCFLLVHIHLFSEFMYFTKPNLNPAFRSITPITGPTKAHNRRH